MKIKRDQKTTIGDMKNDFLSLKEYNRIQLGRITIFIIVIYATYYRQLSTDIQMYNHKIKTIFVSPEMPKVQTNKTGLNIMIAHFYIRRKLDIRDTIHDF